jgi:ribosomal protein S18 acetylase RimI-like enzyme
VSRTVDLRFRAAAVDDAPAIRALVESAYRGDSSRAGWTTEADLLDGQRIDVDGVRELIAAPAGRIVLACAADGALLGCANIQQEGEACYFGMFSVRPTLQGGGIGDALLGECERIARDEWRAAAMRMTVIWTRAELIAWYERRGSAPTGDRKPFPYGDQRFGLPRRDDLAFIVLSKPLQV